jgi:hypothetical protein
MKRFLIVCVTLGVSAVVAPVASASPADTVRDGCFYSSEPVVGRAYAGVIGDLSLTFDGSGAPTGAHVTCWLTVNGVEAPGTRHTYGDVAGVPGVQAGADTISYDASPTDTVSECMVVVFADNTTTGAVCFVDTSIEYPPQAVWDFYESMHDGARDAACGDSVNACDVLCPPLASVAGTYSVLTIGPDGDVYVLTPFKPAFRKFVDCPA